MATPLLADLSPQKQEILATLAHHPGFEILVQLFDASCVMINQRLVKLDPADEHYESKLKEFHLQSRAINEFCSAVLKAIDYHSEVILNRQDEDSEEQKLLVEAAARILRPMGNPFGPNTIRKGA